MLNDLRYAIRMLLKNPGFTAVAVLTLAVGIGTNVAVFSCMNALVFRSPPGVKDPARVVYLHQWMGGLPYAEFEYLRDHNRSCSELAASAACRNAIELSYSSSRAAQQIEYPSLMLVSGNYFSVLGAQPAVGRAFLPEEDRTPGTHPVIILSHRFWSQRFNADPAVVGKSLSLNGTAFTVVGIAPADLPREPGAFFSPDAWIPMMMRDKIDPGQNDARPNDGGLHGVQFYGRLKPDVAISQARVEFGFLDDQFAREFFEPKVRRDTWASHLQTGFAYLPWRKELAALVTLIMLVVSMVLLIACANLANFLLARATTRQREMSVRLALGASRARLVRQLLTESLLVALLSGAGGLFVGVWASLVIWPKFVLQMMPTGWADSFNFGLDWRIFEYATILTLVTGVIFGLFPAIEAAKASISTGLKQERALWGRRISRSRLRDSLVVGQVAVSLTLLIVTSLMLRRIQTGITRGFGFDTGHILMLDFSSFSSHPREFQDSLLEQIRAIPGVESGSAARVWYGQHIDQKSVLIDGQPPNRPIGLNQSKVTPGYFATLGIPIIRGRNFSEVEARNDAPVVIVSETFAQRFWPNKDALGHRLRLGKEGADAEVIGIARDGVTEIRSQYELAGYSGDLYAPLTIADKPEIWVRTAGDPLAIVPILRQAIPQLDKDVRFGGRRLKDMAEQWIKPTELLAAAVGVIGILALLLVSCGLYGVMAYAVAQRRQEIGIRMAVGAQRNAIMKLMLWQGLKLVLAGIALGLLGSGALSVALRSVLYGLSPFDPITFAGVSLCLIGVALAACYIPAREATRVDPMTALRAE